MAFIAGAVVVRARCSRYFGTAPKPMEEVYTAPPVRPGRYFGQRFFQSSTAVRTGFWIQVDDLADLTWGHRITHCPCMNNLNAAKALMTLPAPRTCRFAFRRPAAKSNLPMRKLGHG